MTGGSGSGFIYSLKKIEQSNGLWYCQGVKRWKECQKKKGCLYCNFKVKTFNVEKGKS